MKMLSGTEKINFPGLNFLPTSPLAGNSLLMSSAASDAEGLS